MAEPADDARPLRRRHVIVCVDDDEPVLKALRRSLRQEPYQILTTAFPAQALAWIQTQPVSLVISDQQMPLTSGVDVLVETRRCSPDTVCVLLTGNPSNPLAQQLEKQGLRWLIRKPWDDGYLRRTVHRLLAEYEVAHPDP